MFSNSKMALETLRLDPARVTCACTLSRDSSPGDVSAVLRGTTTGVSSGSGWEVDGKLVGFGEEGGVVVGDGTARSSASCARMS